MVSVNMSLDGDRRRPGKLMSLEKQERPLAARGQPLASVSVAAAGCDEHGRDDEPLRERWSLSERCCCSNPSDWDP